MADTADPLAGSYAIEHLTNEIERLAFEYIAKIDEMGRECFSAIEAGYVQREIKRRLRFQKAVEAKR